MAPSAIATRGASSLPPKHTKRSFNSQSDVAAIQVDNELLMDSPVEKKTVYVPPTSMLPASTRLQKMIHESDQLVVCPGVYDGLSARTAHEVGFDALYMVRQLRF